MVRTTAALLGPGDVAWALSKMDERDIDRLSLALDLDQPGARVATLEELREITLFSDEKEPAGTRTAGGNGTGTAQREPAPLAHDATTSTGAPLRLAELVLNAQGVPVSALDKVLLASLRAAAAQASRATLPADLGPALVELLRLDPEREASWFLLGFGVGDTERLASSRPSVPPATIAHGYLAFLGRLCAALERDDYNDILDALIIDGLSTARLLRAPEGAGLAATVLRVALTEEQPTLAAELLGLMPQPFPGWPELLAEVRAVAAAWIDTADGQAGGELLLRAAEGRMAAWSAPHLRSRDEADPEALAAEKAELAVLRAARHRRAGDFGRARRLLDEVAVGVLSDEGRARAAWEQALAEAEIHSVVDVGTPESAEERAGWHRRLQVVPGSAEERARWYRRLDAVAPLLEMALKADPGWAPARLLLAVAAVAGGDEAAAARELRLAEPYLARFAETTAPLVSALCCHLALGELARAAPDDEKQAWGWLVEAFVEGYEPPVDALLTTCRALCARGSPYAAELLAWAANHPAVSDEQLETLVTEPAGEDGPGAITRADYLGTSAPAPRPEG
jgi:hypothetical protein